MRTTIARRLAAAALLTLGAGSASAQPTTYAYAEVGGRELLLNFYEPTTADPGPAPLIIWIHGGGWRSGTRAGTGSSLSLRGEGYAVASIDYRLTSQASQWGGEPVTWPAQAHDVKAAVRWLRAHAVDLNIDPCAFISWGSSAGGHLSAILGTSNGHPFLEGSVGEYLSESSDVQLAVDYFGPADILFLNQDATDPPGSIIDHDAIDSPESLLLGAEVHGYSIADIRAHIGDQNDPWPELVQLARTASPARLANHAASNVPVFIAHGDMDTSVPIAQSQRLSDALTGAGTPAAFITVPGAGHGLPNSIALDVRDWLAQQLPLLPGCGCIPDLSEPYGVLDLADVQSFVAAFTGRDASADLNGDGVFDLADLGLFVSGFTVGCP